MPDYLLSNFGQTEYMLSRETFISITYAKLNNTLREYDLLDTKVIPGVNKMVEALREQKDRLITFLLNRELMKTAGAQLANYVNYLFRLNVVDIRQRYLEGLEEELMRGKPDTAISNAEYIEKIYGMTHVILAASDYYQEPVDRKEFAWIFDYFEKNIETILARTKPDVYAEVGLSFLLRMREKIRLLARQETPSSRLFIPGRA
jgi:hypothetical protein